MTGFEATLNNINNIYKQYKQQQGVVARNINYKFLFYTTNQSM